jgi:hypothetical protein
MSHKIKSANDGKLSANKSPLPVFTERGLNILRSTKLSPSANPRDSDDDDHGCGNI